jgi:hypothetical protein
VNVLRALWISPASQLRKHAPMPAIDVSRLSP